MSVRSWVRAALRLFGRLRKRDARATLNERGVEAGQRVWRCWVKGCDFSMPIAQDQVDSVRFCKVHHLVKHHGLAPAAEVEVEPGLAGEVGAYCEVMGVGGQEGWRRYVGSQGGKLRDK
jgi:hypothetical protein